MPTMQQFLTAAVTILAFAGPGFVNRVAAEVKLPAIIGSGMVLQRDMSCPVWGWADPKEAITVTIAGQSVEATTDADGAWQLKLAPMAAGGPLTMVVKGSTTVELTDILVGEVWVCSGQSNMQWAVGNSWGGDLDIAAANYPRIRLLSVRTPGTQTPLKDFKGKWQACSPTTVRRFSAAGFFFGRQLHETVDVPIGLINNSWGGSACEAWIRRDLFTGKELYEAMLARWERIEATPWDPDKASQRHEVALDAWRKKRALTVAEDTRLPRKPRKPRDPMPGQSRPANLYNGRLAPIMPFGIRGVIWYQGEANAGRAYQYRDMFPLMIQNWRTDWGQGDFPFYWAQLADYRPDQPCAARHPRGRTR